MINGSGEILRALGRVEGTQSILLHEVRDLRRDLSGHGERLARVETGRPPSAPPGGLLAGLTGLAALRWLAALVAVAAGIAANLRAEQIASIALALLKH